MLLPAFLILFLKFKGFSLREFPEICFGADFRIFEASFVLKHRVDNDHSLELVEDEIFHFLGTSVFSVLLKVSLSQLSSF